MTKHIERPIGRGGTMHNSLHSETTINVKTNGTETNKLFTSNIDAPQGDSLIPVLFIVYLEHAFKDVRSN